MYKRCVTEQSAQRQRELEAGLLSAMLTQPYEDISVSDLCQAMNIPRKSFYRYFASKDGALHALIDHTILDFSGEMFSGNLEATLATLERFFQFWVSRKPLLDALQRNNLSGILIQRAVARTTEEDLLSAKLFPPQSRLPREYAANFFVTGLLTMVLQWHSSHYNIPVREMAEISAYLLTHPMVDISRKESL